MKMHAWCAICKAHLDARRVPPQLDGRRLCDACQRLTDMITGAARPEP